MNDELKTKITTALRETKKTQIKELLTDHCGGFCALGVIADEVLEVPLFKPNISPIIGEELWNTISIWNDFGFTFSEIATKLERLWKK